jgi:Kef-type K+ transport system membrane component KefB
MYTFLISIAAVVIATKLLGELARRLGQSSILGGLLAGVILGDGALSLLDPRDPAIRALAELGVLILIFQIGLRTNWRSLRRVGSATISVATAGFILPFVAGFAAAHVLGAGIAASAIAGATLTATSTGIAARVLGDAGMLRTKEGEIALSSALAADVCGLVVLSVVVTLAAGARVSASGVSRTMLMAVVFIGATLAVGTFAMPALFRLLDRIRGRDTIGLFALALAVLLAAIGAATGSAMITGAFLAGVILHPTAQRAEIERTTTALGHFFVPIFFATMGASVELSSVMSQRTLVMAAALIAAAVLTKMMAGYAAWSFRGRKLVIGIAMIPRGEAGLIFAQVGLATTALAPQLFSAIVLMIVFTTLITPTLLGMVVDQDDLPEPEEDRGFRTADGRRLTTAGRKQTPTGRR